MSEKLLDPIHPGEVLLEDFMKPLDLSQNALARALKVDARRISEIVRGRRSITGDTALRLSDLFGTTPEFWLNLQSRCNLEIAKRQKRPKIRAMIKVIRDSDAPSSVRIARSA